MTAATRHYLRRRAEASYAAPVEIRALQIPEDEARRRALAQAMSDGHPARTWLALLLAPWLRSGR